jgi:hypothetical protein
MEIKFDVFIYGNNLFGSPDQDVIGILEKLAEEMIKQTLFFHPGPAPSFNTHGTR